MVTCGMSCVSAALILSGLVAPAYGQQVKTFKGWLVACDNRRSCNAFGFESRDNPSGSYVRIERAGDAASKPLVTFAFDVPDEVKDPRLRLSMLGQASNGVAGGVPAESLAAPKGETVLTPAQTGVFINSLASGRNLTIAVLDGTKPMGRSDVSLSGAMAALRFVDAMQKRDGGVTALVARGLAPAGAVLPPPSRPVIAAQTISQLAAPLPVAPNGVQPSKDCLDSPGADTALVAFRLSPTQILWGACQDWGAYNANYAMSVADGQKVTKLSISGFDVPGQPARPGSTGLFTWPALAEDQRTITSITKDEGLGDCGVAASWVWDGTSLRLLELRAMTMCRGVDAGHWPVLFLAARQ